MALYLKRAEVKEQRAPHGHGGAELNCRNQGRGQEEEPIEGPLQTLTSS